MQVINNRAVFDTVNKFAIGLSKDVLLVQRAKSYDANDVSKAFLIHRDHFQPSIHRVVIVSEEDAWLIRSMFMIDSMVAGSSGPVTSKKAVISSDTQRKYYAHVRSRQAGVINDRAHLELFVV
jgi:hypothetical protein